MLIPTTTATAVPAETARVARAVFRHGHPYLAWRDALGPMFTDTQFAALFATRGRPAESPALLVLASVLQYAEGFSDRQTADAVRSRIDWKYALGLDLTDPGFDASVLSEFRTRLGTDGAIETVLTTLLAVARERGLLKARGRQRTDSTHVLAAIRAINRLECVVETMRATLELLTRVAPEWLVAHADPVWVERYAHRGDDFRLPKSAARRLEYAQRVGCDGHQLLAALADPTTPAWLSALQAIDIMRRIWVQQYLCEPDGTVVWRTVTHGHPPARTFISSPYDVDAHYARKHTTSWIGYKLHVTETCDTGCPRLITHVETTSGPIADGAVTPIIHAALAADDLLPATHIVDTGYVDAPLFVDSADTYAIDLCGPPRHDHRWQAHAADGLDTTAFAIDWTHHTAQCPAGHTSLSWTPTIDNRKNAVVKIKFSRRDCRACPLKTRCTKSPRRTITVRPERQYHALHAARAREADPAYTDIYRWRAGIEGTISQAVRRCRARRARYHGLAKTHVQHILTATAINLTRLTRWLGGDVPATTRPSGFATLMGQALAA